MKKKHPEHVNLERWLVSYADFITLLFAFFVVMYSISQADIAKFKKVSQSIKAAFTGGPAGMIDMQGSSGGDTVNQFESEDVPGGRVMNLPAGKTNTASDADPGLQEVREMLEESISLEMGVADVADKLQMQFDSRGLIVHLSAKNFFDEGSAEVRPDLHPLLDRVGRILAKSKRLVRVEGHCDALEAKPEAAKRAGFASGWELSAARAAWVVKHWIKRFDIDPSRLAVAGQSDYRPVASGTDEWSRAKNRRVDIIILNGQFEAP